MRYSMLHLIQGPHWGILRRHRHRGGEKSKGCLEGFSGNLRENRFTNGGTPSLKHRTKHDERNIVWRLRWVMEIKKYNII